MKKTFKALLAGILALTMILPTAIMPVMAEGEQAETEYTAPESPAVTYNLNVDWKFKKASGTVYPLASALASVKKGDKDFYAVDYDDSDWETVSVPHPINAEDSFDDRCYDSGEANQYRGFMFYRKHITVPAEDAGKKMFLEFESVRQTVYLYVNGEMVGYYEAGITASGYDITNYITPGADNVIAVATDNSSGRGNNNDTKETKPGSAAGAADGNGYQWNTNDFNETQGGITGNVNLYVKGTVYQTLPLYNNLKTKGNYIYATDFDIREGKATIHVDGEIRNEGTAAKDVTLEVNVVDMDGKVVSTFSSQAVNVAVASDKGVVNTNMVPADAYAETPAATSLETMAVTTVSASAEATGLKFWSPDSPNIYDVYTVLKEGETVLDVQKKTTGFRKVEYDITDGGLKINDQPVWLTGYAQRATNEWAVIGVANDWLEDYDMQLIKESNSNFIRWMHVAPKPSQIRSGDKYGVVSVCPAGDKEADTEGRQWDQRVEAMRDAMIYFRNSPSVIFWEAGNNAVTAAHQQEMTDLKAALDPDGGRFCGCRTISSVDQINAAEYAGTMLNRHAANAKTSMTTANKYIPIMETEYARDESPRRVWDRFSPPDYEYNYLWLGPGGSKTDGYNIWNETQEDFVLSDMSGYNEFYSDRVGGSSGNDYYSAAAMMVWSDSNMHNRNTGTENCRTSGKVDPVRIKKEAFYAMQAAQSSTPKVHIVGHWNYPQYIAGDREKGNYWYKETASNGTYYDYTGRELQRDPTQKTVYVIGSSGISKVELYVNDILKGTCTKPTNSFVYSFPGIDVTESGKVSTKAYNARDEVVAEDDIVTAGEPAKIVLSPVTGPDGLIADGSDIAYFDVEVQDAQGNVCPLSYDKLNMRLDGKGVLLGGYNSGIGDKNTTGNTNFCYAECGTNRIFVRSTREAGDITLTVNFDGQAGTSAKITSKDDLDMEGGMTLKSQRTFAQGEVPEVVVQEVEPLKSLGNVYTSNFSEGDEGNTYIYDPMADVDNYTMRVNGKKVTTYAQNPYRPDSITGVLCDTIKTLEALKAAGVNVEYTVQTTGDLPAGNDGKLPMVHITGGLKSTYMADGEEKPLTSIDITNGSTTIFVNGAESKNLLNAEITEKNGEIIADIAAVLSYIDGVSYNMNTNTKTGNIIVSSDSDKAVLEYGEGTARVTAISPLTAANLIFASYNENGTLKSCDIQKVSVATMGAYVDKTPAASFTATDNMKVMLWGSDMATPLANAVVIAPEASPVDLTSYDEDEDDIAPLSADNSVSLLGIDQFATADAIDMTYATEIINDNHNSDDTTYTDGPDGTKYLKVSKADTKIMNVGSASSKEIIMSFDFRFDEAKDENLLIFSNSKNKTGPQFSLKGTTLQNEKGSSHSVETVATGVEAGKWYSMELEGKFVAQGASVTARVYSIASDGTKTLIATKSDLSLRNFYAGSGNGDFEFIKAQPGISIDNEYAVSLYADNVTVSSLADSVKAGGTVQLSALAKRGAAEVTVPTFTWAVYNEAGTELLNDENITVSDTGLLVTTADATSKTVTVRATAATTGNPYGTYKVTVQAVDKSHDTYDTLTITPDKNDVRVGSDVTFTATASKAGEAVTPTSEDLIYSVYNAANLRPVNNSNITITQNGVLSVTDKAVAQTVTVRGTNKSGSVTATKTIQVLPANMNKDNTEDTYSDTYIISDACEEYPTTGAELNEGSWDGSGYYTVKTAYGIVGASTTADVIYSADMKFPVDGAGWDISNTDNNLGFQMWTTGTKLDGIGAGNKSVGSTTIDTEKWYHVELMCSTGNTNAYGVCTVTPYNEDGTLGTPQNLTVTPRNMNEKTADRINFKAGTLVDNAQIFYVAPNNMELTLDASSVLAGGSVQATTVASRNGVAFPNLSSSLIKYEIYDADNQYPLGDDKIKIGADGKITVDALADEQDVFVRVSSTSGSMSDSKKLSIKSSDIFTTTKAGFNDDYTELVCLNVTKNAYYDDDVTFVVEVLDANGSVKDVATKKMYGDSIPMGDNKVKINMTLPENFNKATDTVKAYVVTKLSTTKTTEGATLTVTNDTANATKPFKITGLPAFDTKAVILVLAAGADEGKVTDDDILYLDVVKSTAITDHTLSLPITNPAAGVKVKAVGNVSGVNTFAVGTVAAQ